MKFTSKILQKIEDIQRRLRESNYYCTQLNGISVDAQAKQAVAFIREQLRTAHESLHQLKQQEAGQKNPKNAN